MGAERIDAVDWDAAAASLTDHGFAHLSQVLSAEECGKLIALYDRPELFRSRIDMAKFRFGKGEYQYFRYPLPPLVEALRQRLYPRLAPVANRWAGLLRNEGRFPETLDALLEQCHDSGQTRPTPLMLRYGAGDFNCLHQDIYGPIAFPFQVVFSLSEPGRDYSGGEFLLLENIPRAQSMGRALQPRQGDAIVATTRHRPATGKRGVYKVSVRHGVSPITAGHRWTLGIIFHDAE
ncbi:MAG TPA: 2OG-Fe(II) oxygenase [Bryobacteraceae bacterium]